MADKDFKVKSGLDLGTPLPLTEGGTGQTSASNALNALLPVQTDNSGKVLTTDGSGSTSWVSLPNGYQKGDTASRPGSPSLGDIYSNTQTGYIEVYTSAGWSQLGVIPGIPTIGTATDVGTNRAYNNAAVSVTFTASESGGLASSYTASSTTGGYSTTGSSSPLIVTGIPSNTSLTFSVTATNGYGNSLATTASNSVTATSVPQSPTIGSPANVTGVSFGSTCSATLAFTTGATGGKSITNYKYSTNGSTYNAFSPAQTTSPVTITGLTSGTSYAFYLKAVNSNGDSIASSSSSSITASTIPQAPTIGTVTRTSNTQVSIPFTAGSNGNSTITSYTATSNPSVSLSVSGTTSPLSVTGSFASNTAYTFTISAVNANGTSISSSSSNSITPSPLASVTGGTLTSDATYYYRTFTANDNLVVSNLSIVADYAIVGGGGSGGSGGRTWTGANLTGYSGGGGGGGGVREFSNQTISPANYPIVIGAGGGNSSSFNSISAAGGGYGGSGSGGSGGGGGASYKNVPEFYAGPGGAGNTPAVSPSQGNNGGSGYSVDYGFTYNSAGGGGGAGGAGSNAVGAAGGAGGSAKTIISSIDVGGGGGGGGNSNTSAGSGAGGGRPFPNNGISGSANRGGGGGGVGSTNDGTASTLSYSGGNGGSGVVVVRYTRSQVGG